MSDLSGGVESDCRHIRVAVIDDNPLVLGLIREMLDGSARYEVAPFAAAADALSALMTTEFDIVLCDIEMPGMSGIDFFQRLRSCRPAYAQRMIFITGDQFAHETQRFLAETGSHCLCKPFRRADLEGMIGAILAGRSGQPAPLRKVA